MNALQLFRDHQLGYIEIAAHFGTTEAVIEKVIDKLRTAERLTNRAQAAAMKHAAQRLLEKKVANERIRSELGEIRARAGA
jgi:hypothetical protein